MEIDLKYQEVDFFGTWILWFLWGLRSESINSWRYGLIEEDLGKGSMENLDQYKRIIDESLWCIIVLLFWLIKFQKLKFFVIMTQSQLLNHGEEQKNGEGMRKRLKISVAHFDNSALIKTYSKTLIGRCMNPEEQEMKALFTNLPKDLETGGQGYG